MNVCLFWLPLLIALLFASTPTDGAKHEKLKTKSKQSDDPNDALTVIVKDSNDKSVMKETSNNIATLNNATKIIEKSSYPKKVQSLKKRPTKTPNSIVTSAATQSTKNKRKKVSDVTTAFKDLPADDLEFIKELDKQFKLHGEKIKIKVEHDNSTEGEKQTSKRTIDGELGYGAYSAHNGYVYERPKFMFYPYSQQNIAADAPGYYPPKTDVSIEPSYSYELQPQSYVQERPNHDVQQPPEVLDVPQHSHQEATQQGQHGAYEEPVIVLRIPGPTKYASHLQALLQQYLEIRAAQYLRLLEEAEQQKQQQYSQQHLEQPQHEQQHQHLYEQQVQQQHAYAEPTHELQPPAHEPHAAQQLSAEEEHSYSPEVTYAHQVAPTPQSVVYPEIDDVYQGYKGKLNAQQADLQQQHLRQQQEQQHQHQHQQQVEYAPQQEEEVDHAQQQLQHGQHYFVQAAQQPHTAQQYYYAPEASQGAHGNLHYQNVYILAAAPQGAYDEQATHAEHAASLQHQPIYVQEEEQELQHQQQQQHQAQLAQQEEHHALVATHGAENNPRQTHTKVIYTHNSEKGAADYAGGYVLPSIRPYERHRGISPAAYHQQQQQLQAQLLHEQQHEQLEEQQQQQQQQHQFDYDTPLTHGASEQEQSYNHAANTQRPFNYHAHSAKAARRRNRKRGARAPTTTAATPNAAEVDAHLQQIREFVRDNLGAQMSTAVEFKTTTLVKS